MALMGAASIAQAQGPGGRGGSREEMIKKYDKDGDGQLNEEERNTMREEMQQQGGGKQGEGQQRGGERLSAADLIAKFDADADGKLDATEVEAMMKEQQSRMQSQQGRRGGPNTQGGQRSGPQGGASREEMLKKYDKDGDGQLSEEERAEMRKDMQSRRGGN